MRYYHEIRIIQVGVNLWEKVILIYIHIYIYIFKCKYIKYIYFETI